MLPRGTHEFIDDLSDDTTEDDLKFFEVTQWLNSQGKGYLKFSEKIISENNFKVIPKFTEQDIIQAVNFDMVSDHVIKTFVPPAFRQLFFRIKK